MTMPGLMRRVIEAVAAFAAGLGRAHRGMSGAAAPCRPSRHAWRCPPCAGTCGGPWWQGQAGGAAGVAVGEGV